MNARGIIKTAGLALLASLALSGLVAQDREPPEPREAPEPRETPEPREALEPRETPEPREAPEPREVHEPEVREAGEKGTEAGDTGQETGQETDASDIGWQADAIRDEGADRDETGNPVRRGEIIAFALPAAAEQQLVASGFRVIRRTALASLGDDVVRLAVPRGQSLPDALRAVRAAAPAAVTDFDHYYGLGLASGSKPKRNKADSGPAENTAALRVSIGMIDTAVTAHPALGTAQVVSWKPGEDAHAASQHGTAVASLMATRGAATIYSANIFRGPAAHPFTSVDILAEAMEWLMAQGAPVINMSIAGPPNALLEKLVAIAGSRGRMIVAAAGNSGPSAPPVYPAALPGVIAVTAVDPALRVYRYANHGGYIAVAAQGVGVLAARAEGGYARFTGTSFAAPLVSARLARCRAEGASSILCKGQLLKSARDLGVTGYDDTYGHGYIE
ncbi:MAG: S8 family serine peptidase [Novosphingobium sp.]